MKEKITTVLFVCIGSNVGGIEKSLINILNKINYEKYYVDLLLWEAPGELYRLIPDKVNIIDRGYIDVVEKKYLKNYSIRMQSEIVARYIYKKILSSINGKVWNASKRINKQYDVAIAFSQNDYSGEYVIDRVNACRKFLWFHHGIYDLKGIHHEFNLQYYPKFDAVIAVSDACKLDLLRVFPSMKSKIKVLYNEIDSDEIIRKSEEFSPTDVIIKGCCIVTVGRIAEEKGTEIAIEVAKKLKENGCLFTWIFVGKGTMWDIISEKIKNYDLEQECILIGAKSNPYPYMKMADIYVQPSKVEAFGLTVGEAKVLNKKIIAFDLPEIKKQLLGYHNAKIVQYDILELYNTILQEINCFQDNM